MTKSKRYSGEGAAIQKAAKPRFCVSSRGAGKGYRAWRIISFSSHSLNVTPANGQEAARRRARRPDDWFFDDKGEALFFAQNANLLEEAYERRVEELKAETAAEIRKYAENGKGSKGL